MHEVNARGAVRWNTAFAYLDPARDRPNLDVAAGTLVDRVLLDGERAVGLTTDAGELRAGGWSRCAAGAYGSPAILLRSGIEAGEGLGRLCDHVGVGSASPGPAALAARHARRSPRRPCSWPRSSVPRGAPGGDGRRRRPPVLPGRRPGRARRLGGERRRVRDEARSRGRVRLASADPREPPLIDHGFLADEHDAAVLAHGVERLRELAARDPIRAYAAASSASRAGGARGRARADGAPRVLPPDRHLRDRPRGRPGRPGVGVRGLVVADASIMPTIPRANTHLSTLAVAERLAERMLAVS